MINLLEYLEKTVTKFHNKTAFCDEKNTMTFGELYELAKNIGTFLAQKGCINKPVILFMEKGVAEIAAFLGVMYAGCYYVPVDSEMPIERIEHIFQMIPAGAVICDETGKAEIPDTKIPVYNYVQLQSTIRDDELLSLIREQHIDTNPAYIVFTSGSTGVPKGVVANHRSVIDYVEQLSEVLKIHSGTVFGNQAPFYVDACLKEIYPTLKFGATTILIPRKKFRFPVELVQYLNKNRINTICWVVPALTMISSLGTFRTVIPEYLETVAFGSEVFPVRQFNIWREHVHARYINLYGPTECTGMSSYYIVNRTFDEKQVIPIGKPFRNTDLFLIDSDGKKIDNISSEAESKTGEIYIRGTCVTMGYFGNREQTEESFVQNPLQNDYPELVYRTGDLGKYVDGELVFVSRKDNQIKHMGYRIELGEIEAAVNQQEGVENCVCLFLEGQDRLVLYVQGDIDIQVLQKKLKELLPSYMVPSEMKQIDRIPLTLNGKTDRKCLKERYLKERREKRNG